MHQDYNNTVCSVSNCCKVADGENGETTHLKFCGLHTHLMLSTNTADTVNRAMRLMNVLVSIFSMYQTHTSTYIITVSTEYVDVRLCISQTEQRVNDLLIWLTAMAGPLFIMRALTITRSL